MDAPSPWFDAAFERDYMLVYPHRDVPSARREVAGLVARGLGALRGARGASGRVLDLGCGFGRHLLALREEGLQAYGLDRSRNLLARADASLAGRVARGDFRALPFAARSFGAVLMLFSSFGYFDADGDAGVLDELARVLEPAGLLVLDLMNPERVRTTLVPESRTRRDALEIHERRELAREGTRVLKEVRLLERGKLLRSWREDVRLYEPGEIGALLAARGFEHLRTEGDFDGGAFAADSVRQLVWARRAAVRDRFEGHSTRSNCVQPS